MRDYGGQADIQFVRDLFVDQSFGDQDQHLDFACREFVSGGRRGRRHVLYRIAVVVRVLVEFQDVLHQPLFRLVDVEYRDARKLELVTVSRQYDGFPLSGRKKALCST